MQKDGEWLLVYESQDYRRDDVRDGFKGRISKMSDRDKESMREFAKLIFNTILENDTDLQYESADNKNFELGIACPAFYMLSVGQAMTEFIEIIQKKALTKFSILNVDYSQLDNAIKDSIELSVKSAFGYNLVVSDIDTRANISVTSLMKCKDVTRAFENKVFTYAIRKFKDYLPFGIEN